MKLKVLDLFAGIGGFSLGLERTGGFETVAFCEIDKKAQKVLKKHWPDVPVFNDVKGINAETLNAIGIRPDVITGGFPCQDISTAGKGAGLAGERSGLWFELHRIIKETKPQYAIIENVSALRSRGLEVVLKGLAEIGYDAEWHCIPASALGAPHQRDRIWIVAYPTDQRSDWGIGFQGNHAEELGQWASDASGSIWYERSSDVAYPNSTRKLQSQGAEQDERGRFGNSSGEVADSSSQGLPGSQRLRDHLEEALRGWSSTPRPASERCPVSGGTLYSWSVEPNVGRVADGVPGRVDRLKQLGNAVVPQIPELIGMAILRHNSRQGATVDSCGTD